jgi:dimethylhistidine N-methyltransferase
MRTHVDEDSTETESPIAAELAIDVLEGLSAKTKSIPCRWLYDRAGAELFTRIMELPEYYPTRRETEIFKHSVGEVAKVVAREPLTMIEFGAGDGRKTSLLLEALMKADHDLTYIPVDISRDSLHDLCRRMRAQLGNQFTDERFVPFAGDNIDALTSLAHGRAEGRGAERFLVVFLGSSIGNCMREDVDRFVARVRSSMREGDYFLIGFDLIKDLKRILPAYNDTSGVTRDFNMNLLARLNREIGANFDVAKFSYEAIWNPAIEGVESWLFSKEDQWIEVAGCGRPFHFRQWEGLRTEVSLKFREDDIVALAERNGFRVEALYKDASGEFLDALWVATHFH